MKVDIWMPLYIGDYLADTIGLTNSEHGAYLLSMMKYWRKGESLTPKELREVCGKDIDRVCNFYTIESNRWHHKRIDQELATARKRSSIARVKSLKGVASRRDLGQLPQEPAG
jgi:uncharacterized protein YdaU (DUF1376 family)